MAGSITAAGIEHLLALFSAGEEPAPTLFIALITDLPPGFSISGEDLTEPDGYDRAVFPNDSGSWQRDELEMYSAIDVYFPEAETDWGTINYWAICDDAEAGRVLFCGEFLTPVEILTGDTFVIPAGGMSLAMSGDEWAMG